MIFCYDLTLNFNKELYDFYDWNINDDIKHYRKIPLIKICDIVYKMIIQNKLKVDKEFLDYIKEKTQYYVGRMLKTDKYSCVFTNGYDVIAVIFDSAGNIHNRSRLTISEEIEVIELSSNLKVKKIKYEKINNDYYFNYLTRKEFTKRYELIKELEKYKMNSELLSYLYYEYTNKYYNGKNCYEDLLKEINREYSIKYTKLFDILNIIKVKNV